MKIIAVAGARPNFVKIAPLMRALRSSRDLDVRLVNTGQHYDPKLSHIFFEELRIDPPDVDLSVGSASHATQTAEVMKRFEPVVLDERPDVVLVVGDVNSTLACAITAVKLNVPVAHVEAGLRSFDRFMPEEINRLLTDAISQWLFVSERSGLENLRQEGVDESRIHFVGNVMIDTLLQNRERAEQSDVLKRLNLVSRSYAVVTLHRPSAVDEPASLNRLLAPLIRIGRELPIVFPVHPRTQRILSDATADLAPSRIRLIDPLGYLDFLKLMAHARLVLTDSGGIQEETTALRVPCLTMRTSTERPVTITEGTNTLVGLDPDRIVCEANRVLACGTCKAPNRLPEYWDGHTAERIVSVLREHVPLLQERS